MKLFFIDFLSKNGKKWLKNDDFFVKKHDFFDKKSPFLGPKTEKKAKNGVKMRFLTLFRYWGKCQQKYSYFIKKGKNLQKIMIFLKNLVKKFMIFML